ncbi:hypothetical protein [Erythrobacter sp. EC-HK427]|uniref:hypothetical protein n=1 Tax=Erythrobacter sp. EC-HK427 TaxID=2038396 RepID=UPI00125FF4C1|nr:hypothetical protein [Erythrobacter sp. EC-HK427]
MTMRRTGMIKLGMAAIAAAYAVVPAAAQAPELEMLDNLDRGSWTLTFRSGEPSQRICLRTGRELIQLRHRQPGCEQFVVRDGADEVTVQYTCRGNGYGRTTIRREGNSLVQVDSQGIVGGAPFSMTGEARRTSPTC